MSEPKPCMQQMRNFSYLEGDRIDPVAQTLRRLYARVECCPCSDRPHAYPDRCLQCRLDLEAIQEAWDASASLASSEPE